MSFSGMYEMALSFLTLELRLSHPRAQQTSAQWGDEQNLPWPISSLEPVLSLKGLRDIRWTRTANSPASW